MYKLTLTILDSEESHIGEGENIGKAAQDLLNTLLLCYDDVMPEVYEGIFQLKSQFDWGEENESYSHYDMSCPEENFELSLTLPEIPVE